MTNTPVQKMLIIGIVLSLVIINDWNVYQYDVSNVFLNGYLGEEVYMQST